MSDTETESSMGLGEATIVYEDPDEGRKEETVGNEQLMYVRDHWALQTGTDEHGNDLVRQIPATRVHYVERNVQQFEEEVQTVRHRVESIAEEVRRKLPVNLGEGDRASRGGTGPGGSGREQPHEIQVEERSGDEAERSRGEGDRSGDDETRSGDEDR